MLYNERNVNILVLDTLRYLHVTKFLVKENHYWNNNKMEDNMVYQT